MATHSSLGSTKLVKPGLKRAVTLHVSKSPAKKQLTCSGWALPSMARTLSFCKREDTGNTRQKGPQQSTEASGIRPGRWGGAPSPPGWLHSGSWEPGGAVTMTGRAGPSGLGPRGSFLTTITLPYSGPTPLPMSWARRFQGDTSIHSLKASITHRLRSSPTAVRDKSHRRCRPAGQLRSDTRLGRDKVPRRVSGGLPKPFPLQPHW